MISLAKQWVILLYDQSRLCGFSTQVLFDFPHENRDDKILFSGDTIIDKCRWGSLALPVAWGRLMLSLESRPHGELYWLLTSKGYKTYRFLPVFFHEFYPCYSGRNTGLRKSLAGRCGQPALRKALRRNARSVAGRSGRPTAAGRSGRTGQPNRLRDPHVAFFQNRESRALRRRRIGLSGSFPCRQSNAIYSPAALT